MGYPGLRARATPVDPADLQSPRVQQLIDDMIDTMREYHGVGLAGPQVHEALRLLVADIAHLGGDGAEHALVLVNPEVSVMGNGFSEDWEGCLSIPDLRGRVPRAQEISVRAFDRRGLRVEMKARDFAARVIQHEADHLDGVLFIDRMKSFESLTHLDEYARYWEKP